VECRCLHATYRSGCTSVTSTSHQNRRTVVCGMMQLAANCLVLIKTCARQRIAMRRLVSSQRGIPNLGTTSKAVNHRTRVWRSAAVAPCRSSRKCLGMKTWPADSLQISGARRNVDCGCLQDMECYILPSQIQIAVHAGPVEALLQASRNTRIYRGEGA
jgi:hypothetical protein